jgi:hypothetical protein
MPVWSTPGEKVKGHYLTGISNAVMAAFFGPA